MHVLARLPFSDCRNCIACLLGQGYSRSNALIEVDIPLPAYVALQTHEYHTIQSSQFL